MKMGWENKFAGSCGSRSCRHSYLARFALLGPGARLIIEVKGEIQASGPFLFLFSPACLVTPGRGKIREAEN